MTKRTIRWLLSALALAGLVFVYASAPYLLPTRIALGPCGKDWTSPTSYFARTSPTRALAFRQEGVAVKVCYGSPSMKGRAVFGGLVPWGELWRMGANEPTRIFVDGPVELGGIALSPGRYSIYALPGPDRWSVMVSESTFHWGNAISPSVRDRELGSISVEPLELEQPVESLKFQWRPGPPAEAGTLELEWATTRVAIPLRLGTPG